MPTPYTFKDHAKTCQEAAQRRVVLVQWVQARLGQITHCGRICEAWTSSDGLDLWKLETVSPRRSVMSVPTHKTTKCSGVDGRCVCAGEPGLGPLAVSAARQGQAGSGGMRCW
jgi:hypothetical protein